MKDHALFCPTCHSPAVEVSILAGGAATCKSCKWQGQREDLSQVPFEHDFVSSEEMILRFVKQVASIIVQSAAVDIGRVLLTWGFIDEKNVQEELREYLKGMALAAAQSAVETRQALELKRTQRGNKNAS